MLPFADGHGVKLCSCSPWLLSMFPQSCGSAVAFLTAVWFSSAFSSAMVLGCAPCALSAVEAPASFIRRPSPWWGFEWGLQVTPPQAGWGARGAAPSPCRLSWGLSVCLSVLCSDLGSSPEICSTSTLNHFTEVGRKGQYGLYFNKK